MAKRSLDEVGFIDAPPTSKRPKLSPPPTPPQQEIRHAVVPDVLIQRAGIIQMSKRTDAPFRLDDRGDVDCSLDWCTYSHFEYTKVQTRGLQLRVIEIYLTPDKLVFPQSVAIFNGFVIFEHGLDKIKGRIPFLSAWVRYEFTIVEDLAARAHPANDGFIQCVIIKCRWKLPTLDDQLLSDLLVETGVAVSQEALDCVRTGIVKHGGYDEITDTYDPKVLLSSLQEPKDASKLQNSPYMILRYCAPSVLIYGHANTVRTSYSALMDISKCLLSTTWYYLFFQWFKRMPETLLPQESRFLRELSLADLTTVKTYFCIQPFERIH